MERTSRRTMRETLEVFNAPNNRNAEGELLDGEVINRLFGDRDAEAEDAHQGYLRFYPTFFDQISLEIINPHDRSTRAGTVPIPFEAVPRETTGNFILLYTPIVGIQIEKAQIDFKHLVKGIWAMMRIYGFSAKATDGYGRAKNPIRQIDKDFPMLKTNSLKLAPNLDWQTDDDDDDNKTFYVPSFPTLTVLKEIGE